MLRERWGPWAPRYPAAWRFADSNSALAPKRDWVATALDFTVPATPSDLVPPDPPLFACENSPQLGAATTQQDAHADNFS